jgi:hypothetical protein
MAIQNENNMSGSERCRLIAERMLAEAQSSPGRGELSLRVAHAWSELAKNLRQAEAAREADPRIILSAGRPRPRPIEVEVDGAAFIARW